MRENGTGKRALLYARVSSATQKDNSSVDEQLARSRQYATEQGYVVIGSDHDVISGTFILARSAFIAFVDLLAEGAADVIIVDVPDRLGRGGAIEACEVLAKQAGGRIEFATSKRDDSTIEGVALKHTDALVSDVERLNIRRRTMSGKNAWARKGRVIASSYRPYGYRFDKEYDPKTGVKLDCTLVPVEEEAEIVRQMFEWCAFEGLSTYRIAKRLTEMEIPTLSDKDDVKKKKSGGYAQWHRDTVHGILTSETHKGVWRYRKNDVKRVDTQDGVRTEVEERPEEETIAVDVPAIVSEELWDLVQERLKKNAKRNFKPTKYKYLLRGRLRCAKCEGAMHGWTRVYEGKNHTTKSSWYRCAMKYKYGVDAPNACLIRNVRTETLEEPIWENIMGLMLDEEALFQKVEEQRRQRKKTLRVIEHSIAGLQSKISKTEAGLERVLDLYLSGDMKKKRYLAKKGQLEDEIADLKEKVEEKRAQLEEGAVLSPEREAELRRLRAAVGRRLEGATFEQKQQLFNALQLECIYNDDTGEVVLHGVFGSKTLEGVNPPDEDDDDDESQGGSGGSEETEPQNDGDETVSECRKYLHVAGEFDHFAADASPALVPTLLAVIWLRSTMGVDQDAPVVREAKHLVDPAFPAMLYDPPWFSKSRHGDQQF